MKYSKKKYLDYMFKTLDALYHSDTYGHTFINNPGFGNIFDVLKNEQHREDFIDRLERNFGSDYSQTVLKSLQKGSLNSYYTPLPIISSMRTYLRNIPNFNPKYILEPSAGNGLIIRDLLKVYPGAKYTAFEKEILTTRILEHNFKNNDNVSIFGVPFETFDQTSAPKKYGLVVGNIPFGANRIFDPSLSGHHLETTLTRNIHSYFMFKALDKLKPSGLAILLCTKNFMDKRQYASLRKDLVTRNNFLGGVRLPDSAFAQENTAVIIDILVFQNNKGIRNTNEQNTTNSLFAETMELSVGENTVQFNKYYEKHPSHVLGNIIEGGLYDQKDYTVTNSLDISSLAIKINEAMDHFSKTKPLQAKSTSQQNNSPRPVKNNPKLEPIVETSKTNLQSGNLFVHGNRIAKYGPDMLPELLQTKPRDFDKLSKIIALRDMYFDFLKADDDNRFQLHENLVYQYEMFVFQYGKLNDKNNNPYITLDIQGPMILGLESPKHGVFEKAEILEQYQPATKVIPEKQSPELPLEEAIYFSLNKHNAIDLDTISQVTNLQKDDIVREALDTQLLFLNPSDNGIVLAPKFQFLSGIIYKKIDFYKRNDFGEFQTFINKSYKDKAVLELEKIKPPIAPFEDLDIKIHEPWFSLKITQAFIYDNYKTIARIAYNESTSKYMVKIETYDYHFVKKFYVRSEHRSFHFKEILEGALNSTIPYVSKGSGDYRRTDKVKMQEIKMKFDLLYKEFHQYIIAKPDLKQNLEFTFYNLYDSSIHPKYDGDYLKFEGLQNFEPYKSQKDTVAGIVINQGLLVNKEVGFGKTLDMALAAKKMAELSLSDKTLVIGLRSTLIQLEKEFRNAFPTMTVLVAHDKVVRGKQKRETFFKKVVNSSAQVVLMSHDTFKFIPHSPEIIRDIIQEELENLERDLLVIHQDRYNINKRELKGLELRKENLEANLKSIYHQIATKQSEQFSFDKMNFGHIMVDESHIFKNLMYTTRHTRVAGLNTSTGSERSKNLLTAIRTLQKSKGQDFQATFLSGTPISNSITEVYVLFKYLIPQRMEELKITSFDQWAQVFANKSYEFEPTVSGDYKVRERFRSFKKMKLLSSLYNEISIIVNGKTHFIDRPEMELDVHSIKPTPGQLQYFERIKEFLKTGKSELLLGNKNYIEEQKGAMSLIALHHMRNASIDPRLLDGNMEFDEQTKLWHIAAQVYLTYCETNHFKGTQAIFSDLGVPKDTFNVYDEIKKILTEGYDIPKEEVVFIHDFKTDASRLQCFKDVNQGKYRVVIGSTEKLGTGTNIQERLCRIHHVDIPYRPTDVDQRNGRGVRKGNLGAKEHFGNKVIVSFYIVENSTDALMLNNVNTKKNFIEQITNGTIQFNKLDMGPVNENGNIDYRTLLAVAKNDPLYLEKEELTKKFDELMLERNIFTRNRREAEGNIKFYTNELERTKKNISNLEKDLPLLKSIDDSETYQNRLIQGLNLSKDITSKGLNKAIHDLLNTKSSQIGEHHILSLDPAKLVLSVKADGQQELYVKTPNATYGYGSRKVTINPESNGNYLYNALSKIPNALKNQKEYLAEYQKAIAGSQKIVDLSFDKNDELSRIEQRLSEIHKWLDEKYDAEPKEDKKEEKKQELNKGNNTGNSPSISPVL